MLSRNCLGATTEAQIVAALRTPCTLLEMHRKAGTKNPPKKHGALGLEKYACVTWGDLWDLQLYWWLWRLASSTFSSVSTWPKRRVSWVSLQIT